MSIAKWWVVALSLAVGMGRVGGQSLPALPSEQHPGLLFSADDLPLLRERIEREPYSFWWNRVLERARTAPSSFTEERSKARYAKSLAFAYLMTDRLDFAERASAIMQEMKFPPRGGDLGEPHNEGEVVALYALAYDWLHGYLAENDTAGLAEIRAILAEEAERIRAGIVVQEVDLGLVKIKIRLDKTTDPRDLSVIHLDNWHIRAYGGLGLAALALSGHEGVDGETPQDWAEKAYAMVTESLDYQIEGEDGGYAEGPFYSRYAADVYLPYLFALKRLQGIDLFADPKVAKMHDWSVNIRLPSGRRPNVDDGHLDDFYGHYLAGVAEDGGLFRWDWENDEAGLYVRDFSEMDAIVLFDDEVVARQPERGPTLFMPGAGDAVFRSDWSEDALYMLLRGEHGPARERGLAHEHPDETSFILYAYGEMLAVDAGYINFTNHNKVNEGRNHSLILVDGEGPSVIRAFGEPVEVGGDAYIENFFTSELADYAEVRTQYGGVDFLRRVLFYRGGYFLVADQVRGDEEHLYEWRLHGNGGGTSGGSYERSGSLARWGREKADLLAFLPEREGRSFSERDTIHSFDYLEETTHTALRVEQQGTDVDFLAVLYPVPKFRVEPGFERLEAEDSEAVQVFGEGVMEVAWLLASAADSVALAAEHGRLESDGRFGLVQYAELELRGFVVQDGRFLRAEGEELMCADAEVDVSLAVRDSVAGFVRGPDSGFTLSLPASGEVEEASFAGQAVETELADGKLTLALAGAGELKLRFRAVGKPADFDGNGAVDFADFFLFADAFGGNTSTSGWDISQFDLDGSGTIDFGDFFLFADAFGK